MGSGSLFSGAGLGYRNGPAASGQVEEPGWVLPDIFYCQKNSEFWQSHCSRYFEARYGRTAAVLATITTVICLSDNSIYQFRGGGKGAFYGI